MANLFFENWKFENRKKIAKVNFLMEHCHWDVDSAMDFVNWFPQSSDRFILRQSTELKVENPLRKK